MAAEVAAGLEARPRRLPTKYLYDRRGEELFREITRAPEYYLTDCEREILAGAAPQILAGWQPTGPCDVVELGAGDGEKTHLLLEEALRLGIPARYVPVDIARSALDALVERLSDALPALPIEPVCADYTSALQALRAHSSRPQLLLFLGSSIGNYPDPDAASLLRGVRMQMAAGDAFLVGFDLRKDPWIVHAAYNDTRGLTRAFNLNLLHRLNRELGADFRVDAFDHYETYDPVSGVASSFLISLQRQRVRIEALQRSYDFERWEPIRTEISRKYSREEVERLAGHAGLAVAGWFTDSRGFFADALLRAADT